MAAVGAYRRRVRFERKIEIDDEWGQPREEWETLFECRGQRLPLIGREEVASEQLISRYGYLLRIRRTLKSEELTAEDRCVIDTVPFAVRFVVGSSRPKTLEVGIEGGVRF